MCALFDGAMLPEQVVVRSLARIFMEASEKGFQRALETGDLPVTVHALL